MNARTFLEEKLGVSQRKENEPSPYLFQGVLHTKDYIDFTIISDTGRLLHSFSGAKLANRCLPGDHVGWDGSMCHLEVRDAYPMIVGTIELTNPARYGFTKRGIPMYLFTPYDSKYPPFIVGCSEKDRSNNQIALIRFEDWKDSLPFPRGRIEQYLGLSGDFKAEKEALIWQAVPWKYPKGECVPQRNPAEDRHRRKLEGFTFHIDPKGCKDVDDVITLHVLSPTKTRITITISDVACYVEDGSAVDILAGVINQTLYDENGMVLRPMLPTEYSEGACSLLPGKTSYGVSLSCEWNGSSLSSPEWHLSVFQTMQTYTYDEAMNDSRLSILSEMTSFLAGEPLHDSHQWIEQLMLFYNKEAGKIIKREKNGLLRRHCEANQEKVKLYQQHLPEWKYLAMNAAEYCDAEEKETYHCGIETDAYAHASSPIRRYADLVNQRIIKEWLIKKVVDYIVPITVIDFQEREKAIKRFAREREYLNALETGLIHFQAILLKKTMKEEGREMKLTLYVPAWKRSVSATYKALSDSVILSRDETEKWEVTEFKQMMIECTYDIHQRNWKNRILFRIHPLPSPSFVE